MIEPVRETLDSVAAREFIKRAITAYAEGGPDREAECLALARVHGIDEAVVQDGFAAAREAWEHLEVGDIVKPAISASLEQTDNDETAVAEPVALKAKPPCGLLGPIGKGRSDDPAKASEAAELVGNIGLRVQPRAEPEVATAGGPFGEFLDRRAEAREAEELEVSAAQFGNEQAKADDPEPILSKAAPFDTAKEYARRRFFKEGVLATYFHQGEFWEWNGCFYNRVPATRINDDMYAFLDGARVRGRDDEEKTARFKPKPADVEAVMKCLKAGVGLDAQGPMWLGGKPEGMPEAKDVIVFRNGLVDITTCKRERLTPRFWAQCVVDCEYDPQAECSRWDQFLEEVFSGDGEAADFVEEWIGLNMTGETKFQRGAMFVGKPRSGKGTLVWVMEQLAGSSGYVSFSLNTLMRGENSQECLIGKRSGCDPDVRLRPAKTYGSVGYDAGGLEHGLVSLLLKVTGADPITIPRKYIGPWQGVLPMKVTLISNEPPNLNDLALTKRFIKLHFGVCFEDDGRLDVDLKDKLKAELPGIAVRCLGAYRRLLATGEFIQPKSGLALARKVFGKTEGYAEFIDACLVAEVGAECQCGAVWKVFVGWCEANGRPDVLKQTPTASLLSRKLYDLIGRDKIRTMKPHNGLRAFVGLRLKTKAEKGEAWDDEV